MPADLAGGLGAVGLFAVPGYGLTALLPILRRKPLARRAAYGYLLGVGWLAGLLYALSHFLGVPLRPSAIWAIAAVPVAAGAAAAALRRLRRPPRVDPPRRVEPQRWGGPQRRLHTARPPDSLAAGLSATAAAGLPTPAPDGLPAPAIRWPAQSLAARLRRLGGPLAAAALALAAIVCAAVFAEAISDPVNDWDGRMTWGAQTRFIRQAGTVDAAVLRQPRWFVTHPQYPLLLPLAQTAVLEVFHADPDAPLPRALYAAFLPAFLLVLYDGARRAGGARAAALVVLAIAVTPYMLLGAGAATTTYSDLPLAALYGGALVLLLAPRPRADSGLAAGLLLAAAVLTKNEGTLLALLTLVLCWRAAPRRRPAPPAVPVPSATSNVAGAPQPALGAHCQAGAALSPPVPAPLPQLAAAPPTRRAAIASLPPHLRRFLATAAPVLLALALLTSWRAGIVNRWDDAYPQLLRAAQLWPSLLARPAAFVPVLLATMLRFDHWARFWWMVPAVLLAGRRALRHPRNRRLLLAAAAPLAIAWAAYTVHPQPAALAAVSWNRILLQASIPLLIVVAGALAEVFRPWQRLLLARRRSGAS